MEEISLSVPTEIVESLPPDSEDAVRDMEQAVAGWERRLERAIEEAGDPAGVVLDAIERMEARAERYDEFVVELRAWGQSPIYAITWRNLHVSLIGQLADHDGLDLDRERNARLVEDGIRLRDL